MLIYHAQNPKRVFKVDPDEFCTIKDIQEYIISELSLDRNTSIRIRNETGQEIFDNDDLITAQILFFTIESIYILYNR